jgi:hypothetical protein
VVYRPMARMLIVLELRQSHERLTGAELARWLDVNVRLVMMLKHEIRDWRCPLFAISNL